MENLRHEQSNALSPQASTPPRSTTPPLSPMSSGPLRPVTPPMLSAMSDEPPRLPSHSQLSPMSPSLSPPHTAVSLPTHSNTDPSQPLLAPQGGQAQTPSRALSVMRTAATVAAPALDMAAGGLSVSDVVNSTTNHPYVRGMLSGGMWAASGVASLVANSGQSSVSQVATDLANVGAGLTSMGATIADGQSSHGWASGMSYASNASWMGAGLGAMYQGWNTMRDQRSSNWKKFSGGLQLLSGALNAGAGAAGVAATYYAEQNEADPRAYTASLASSALWASASVVGAFSAWAGSGSASRPQVQASNPSVQDV